MSRVQVTVVGEDTTPSVTVGKSMLCKQILLATLWKHISTCYFEALVFKYLLFIGE